MASDANDKPNVEADAPAERLLRRQAPAWLASLTVHLGLLLLLGLITYQLPRNGDLLSVLSTTPEAPELLPREYLVDDAPQVDVGAGGLQGVATAVAIAPVVAETPRIVAESAEINLESVRLDDVADIASSADIADTVLTKGRSDVGVASAAGAIDRLTEIIRQSLEQRPTVVVWIFDQSGSVQGQRQTFVDRFDRVYRELGVLQASGDEAFRGSDSDQPLLGAVIAFGQTVTLRTRQPTADAAELKRAVEGITTDESGMERVFGAIEKAVTSHRRFRAEEPRRNVLLVLITDEAGDDQDQADRVTALCQRLEMPVYCLGVPAPFGLRESVVKYVDPDPRFDQSPRLLPVLQGPETPAPEVVQLAFRGTPEQAGLEAVDSGFGPFALTRLCYETGGEYFAMHPHKRPERTSNHREPPAMSAVLREFFDPQVMRKYQPQYVSFEQYRRTLSENRAREALVQAAELSRIDPLREPRRVFPKRDEADLKRLLDEAQREAAVLEPKLAALAKILEAGKADRAKLTEPRWQAGYDLAVGRVLANRVRTEGYNAVLAQLKQGRPFQQPNSDTWVLTPAGDVSVSSALEAAAHEARELLTRVVAEHPDTPWALLAQRELDEPLGWTWTETRTGVNVPPPRQPGNGAPRVPQDRLRQLPRPAPPQRDIRL